MTERLAIRTDRTSDWDKGKTAAMSRDLTPRESDGGMKSSWAHLEGSTFADRAVLRDPRRAPLDVQALAMFLFLGLHPGSPRRSRITGVSLARPVLPAELVVEDRQPHPVPAYEETHRSLRCGDETDRNLAVERLVSHRGYHAWQYSREEMADVLEVLLTEDLIASDIASRAREILADWRS